jgi:hypothetical protein
MLLQTKIRILELHRSGRSISSLVGSSESHEARSFEFLLLAQNSK